MPSFNTIILSSIANVSVLTVVCVPLIVKLPEITMSSPNVLAPLMLCVPLVLTTVASTAISFAFAVIPSPPTTLNVLSAVISPPPVKPVPAITLTVV